MSLVDALMGGVVFSLASTASLQLYASSLQVSLGREQRQELAARMELALAEGYRQMAAMGAAAPYASCEAAATELAKRLETLGGEGLSLKVVPMSDAVRVWVLAPGLPERSRWYAPATHGLCGGRP